MKKTLITTLAAVALAGSAMAQGTVIFQASQTSSPIKYSTDGGATSTAVPVGSTVPGNGNLNIALYAASNGTALGTAGNSAMGAIPDLSNTNVWKIGSPLATTISALPGRVVGTTITMDALLGPASTTVELEVVAWSGNFTSFSAAVAGGALVAWTGSTLNGGAMGFVQTTGTPTLGATLVTGAGGFNGLTLAAVPEPGTLLLGGLGAASLLLFRRRK